jgi:hypothetical protein
MITINIVWAPLIITLFFVLLTSIVNGFRDESQNELAFVLHLLTDIIGTLSIVIYVILAIIWLFTHIKFTV